MPQEPNPSEEVARKLLMSEEVARKLLMSEEVARKLLMSEDFTSLHNRLNRFNVFSAFGHKEREPRHTELLRYLLDPYETHGLGDAFLRNVLLNLCNCSSKLAEKLFMLDIGTTDVCSQPLRNGRRIDIKVEIPYQCKSKCFIILLEMKIRAAQGIGQLGNYNSDYKDYKEEEEKIYVYLTLDGEDSGNTSWQNVTYDDLILPAVKSTIKAFEDKLDPEILGLLKNYHEVLKSLTEEADLGNACVVEKILKEINTGGVDWGRIEKLSIMRSYRQAIAELKARASTIEMPSIEMPSLLLEFSKWCHEKIHKEYPSNENYMHFLPSCLGSDNDFISANKNLAGFLNNRNQWTTEPAALLFLVRVRRADDESTDDKSRKVTCTIVLGPLKEGVDRGDLRAKLIEILDPKRRCTTTEFFNTITVIGEPEELAKKIKTINTWLENNEDKLEEIKKLIKLTQGEGMTSPAT